MPVLTKSKSERKQEELRRAFFAGKLEPEEYAKRAFPLEKEQWSAARKEVMKKRCL